MMDSPTRHATFVVRVSRDEGDRVSGVVISVRTGERLGFRGLSDVSLVLMRAIANEMPSRVDEGLT